MNISLSPFVPENLVSRDGVGRPVPRQPAHYGIHPTFHGVVHLFIPPTANGSVPSFKLYEIEMEGFCTGLFSVEPRMYGEEAKSAVYYSPRVSSYIKIGQ